MGVEQALPHVPALRRYARLLTGDTTRADDLVQDTLERACAKWSLWRRRPGPDGEAADGGLRAWLMTLMHHIHLNQRRDRRHEAADLPLDDAPEPGHEPMPAVGQRLDLQQALMQLSPALREVLLLVTVEEYTYAETAAMLDVPIGTVMSRLHRAREALRHLMSPAEARSGMPLQLVKR